VKARYLPTLPQLTAETISILFATLVAAYIISQFPPLQKLVSNNSVTLRVG
jgi:hypothetical protein